MEAVRTLKANLKMAGKPCGWCQVALGVGDDTAVCTVCQKEHHATCWETSAGCSTAGCASAPLPRLDAPAAGVPVAYGVGSAFPQGPGAGLSEAAGTPPGYMVCSNPTCRVAVMAGTPICPACKAILSPDGIYHGPMVNAPGAVQSLVYGILGLVVCGVVLGIVAISKGNAAKRAIAADPTLTGAGLATAGIVMGIIDLIAWAIVIVTRASHA